MELVLLWSPLLIYCRLIVDSMTPWQCTTWKMSRYMQIQVHASSCIYVQIPCLSFHTMCIRKVEFEDVWCLLQYWRKYLSHITNYCILDILYNFKRYGRADEVDQEASTVVLSAQRCLAAHQHQRWQEEIEEKRDDDDAVTAEASFFFPSLADWEMENIANT